MKIAVSASGPSLSAEVDPRFGRCAWFLLVETDDWSFQALENESTALGGGAGIQSAELVVDGGARCVLTGNCGPNAYRTLEAAGIEVVAGCSGPVRPAIEEYLTGGRAAVDRPSVPSHFGMGAKLPALDEGELASLKREADTLSRNLTRVRERIQELEGGRRTVG